MRMAFLLPAAALFLLALLAPILRLFYIMPEDVSFPLIRNKLSRRKRPILRKRELGQEIHLLIVLGSGGHTTEMISMIRELDTKKYTFRTYVVSSGDSFSAERAKIHEEKTFEQALEKGTTYGSYIIVTVPRARKIHQSILTTPFSSLYSLFYCLKLLLLGPFPQVDVSSSMYSRKPEKELVGLKPTTPDVILTNGPATGTIVIFASLILRYFSFLPALPPYLSARSNIPSGTMRTIYVESFARVKNLSLSGYLLSWLVDRLIVQWDTVRDGPVRTVEYRGILVH